MRKKVQRKKQENHRKNLAGPGGIFEESDDSPEVLFAPIPIISEYLQRAWVFVAELLNQDSEPLVLMEGFNKEGGMFCGIAVVG